MSTILIAYERDSEQLALDKILTSRGYNVVRCGNGLDALDQARREPPALIVSDILLPKMDGIALCRKWKHDERLRTVPFIFYSTRYGDPKYERFAQELGVERFLSRPAPMESLLKAIEDVLREVEEKTRQPQKPTQTKSSPSQPAATADADALARATRKLQRRIGELEAQEQRAANELARARQLFEGNPTVQWVVDVETDQFVAVNDAALALYGYARNEFLALTPTALMAQASSLEAPAPGLVWHTRKNGSAFAVSLTTRVIDLAGKGASVVSVTDAAPRLRAEREINQAVAAQKALIASAPDGCWIIDNDGHLLDVNDAYCRMSGYRREELLQLTAEDLERSTAGTTTVILNLTRSVTRDRYETKHRRKDGSEFEAEVTVGSLDDAQGRSILFIRDVSERRAQRIRERSQQHRLEALVELFLHADEMDEHALMMRTSEHLARAATSPLAFVYSGDATASHWTTTAWFDSVAGKAHFEEEPVPLEAVPQWMHSAREGRAVLNNDLTAITQPKPLPPVHRHFVIPVTFDTDSILLIGVANRLRDYNDDDRREIKRLGELLGRLLRNKRARTQTLAMLKKTEVAFESTLGTLLTIAERHDPYTAGSTLRVAELAVAIGRELGLDGGKQHALRVAAMLHDVGSTIVPAELLARPAPLTPPEYTLLQLHAAEGAKLLNGMELDGPIAEIVHQHHERWNGSGYPQGLAGEAILLEARIVAVADVVEAMCSNRPHRIAPGLDAAMDEIQRNAGQLYDKRVVEACVKLFFEKGFKWERS